MREEMDLLTRRIAVIRARFAKFPPPEQIPKGKGSYSRIRVQKNGRPVQFSDFETSRTSVRASKYDHGDLHDTTEDIPYNLLGQVYF